MSESTREMLLEHVRHIVAELEGRIPSEKAEEWYEDNGYTYDAEAECWQDEDGDEYEVEESDLDDSLAGLFMEDVLSVEYTYGSDGSYLGAEVCVGVGGPNLYVNTRRNRVEGYWGGEQVFLSYSDVIGLDDWLGEVHPFAGM